MFKEYLNLLIRRESKEVLGKKYTNLWLLTLVLTATFVSIAFSNGSMKYLADKMDDPFTNWVNINDEYRSERYGQFRRELTDPEIQEHFLFDNVQNDHYNSLTFMGNNGSQQYFQIRFFEELNGKLMHAILSDDNVVNHASINPDSLQNNTYGFCLTVDALEKLGYSSDSIPAYIDFMSYSLEADTLGVEMIDGKFARAPMPVFGVVRKLPGNMDMIASKFVLQQRNDDLAYPLDMNNADYQRSLTFFVPNELTHDAFRKIVAAAVPDSLAGSFTILSNPKAELKTWKPGQYLSVFFSQYELPIEVFQSTASKILTAAGDKDVVRIFEYTSGDYPLSQSQYISVNFNSLDSIRAFEKYAKDGFNVQIEMSQVNSKENFNAVSVMANILSWAMIVFSMVCIIMFIVNMLQSYFQKVKRNLGTFKAFGISSGELIRVYVLILVTIVIAAIIAALALSWFIQYLLPMFGVMKDGTFNYLSLWSIKTLASILIMIIATVVTVATVMHRLLLQTPGDLIYDRN